MSADRLPAAGVHKALFYSLGYSGHGVQMAVHMGQVMAEVRGEIRNATRGGRCAGRLSTVVSASPGFCRWSARITSCATN